MNLPDLRLQSIALALGWGIVTACLLVEVLARLRPGSTRRVLAVAGMLMFGLAWLPGRASPAWWLGLAFQWPSTLLVLLAGARLRYRLRASGDPRDDEDSLQLGMAVEPLLPFQAALLLAGAGILLYIGTFGAGPFVYRSGYTDTVVLLFVTLAIAGWYWGGYRGENKRANRGTNPGTNRGGHAMPRTSLLFALAIGIHMATRLPTGNAWDALIDPFIVILSLVACARAALAVRLVRRAQRRAAALGAIPIETASSAVSADSVCAAKAAPGNGVRR